MSELIDTKIPYTNKQIRINTKMKIDNICIEWNTKKKENIYSFMKPTVS